MNIADQARHGLLTVSAASPNVLARIIGDAEPEIRGARFNVMPDRLTGVLRWGNLASTGYDADETLLLSCQPRNSSNDLSVRDVEGLMTSASSSRFPGVLPPFAAARLTHGYCEVSTDDLGFRQIYCFQGPGWAAFSTSSLALALLSGAELDYRSLAAQSLLGWQIGNRSVFAQIHVLGPMSTASISGGVLSISVSRAGPTPSIDADPYHAARSAADFLREWLSSYLDDHPDAVLQLTGGLDSRILLAAVPANRRSSLKATTLRVHGSEDAPIASRIASLCGMQHDIATLDGLQELAAETAFELCISAAQRLDCGVDPVAFAVLAYAENSMPPGPRLSGLGGEFARGFYYFGSTRPSTVTRARVNRLARWRMFTNESVSQHSLAPEFAATARALAVDDLFDCFRRSGSPWPSATDEFYLGQRMRRWAGILATASCLDRSIVNPMLNTHFLSIARSVRPAAKKNAAFLSQILVELDAELAEIPLDGRPAPIVLAHPSTSQKFRASGALAGKVARKAMQRAVKTNKPPVGGEIVAGKVVEHWRRRPELLRLLRGSGVFADSWLDQVVSGQESPTPATVSMMINLIVASSAGPVSAG